MDREDNLAGIYRQARREFIAACAHAGADAVSRVHPARGPDGKALFCDSAAFGPRDAARALLLIAGPGDALTMVLKDGLALPDGARLVAIQALDPFVRAWGRPGVPADWPQKTLATIAAEDLSRVKKLIVLDMAASKGEAALAAALPGIAIDFRTVPPNGLGTAIRVAMDAL